ncbi:MAG: thioredoxin domain-containing protein, partial [Rudaea sp.]
PLTMFLAPDDLTPFYAGTYFPKQARYGMPPFAHVLEQVRGLWDQRRGDVRAQNATLRDFLDHYGDGATHTDALGDAPIRAALEQIGQNFDRTYGGHLGAPKFPHCTEMELLLDLDTADARSMVELTLTRMAAGGIHDQIGGGFCRYSVDERWEIPHFEKMLYDNAQLLPLYAPGAAADGAGYHGVMQLFLQWLTREMIAHAGGFYSALDADSEHEEGKFYLWHHDEVRALLSAEEYAVAGPYFGFDRAANFEQQTWNPIVTTTMSDLATQLALPRDEVEVRLARARAKLFAARAQRVRPGLDDKILTSWNALMISGLARAARTLPSAACTALAENALEFLRANAWHDGRLYAKSGDDVARFPAYLDDYAFLLDGLIEFLQSAWNDRYLAWATALADALIERFEDREHGGFWFTAHDHEALIQRPKPFADEAIPSGNGIAARALLRLGHLLGETRYLDAAERTLRAGYPAMQQMPAACATLQRALNDFLHPRTHIVVRIETFEDAERWRSALVEHIDRRTDLYVIAEYAGTLPGTLAAQSLVAGGVAYLCRGTQCEPPIATPAALVDALRASR